MAITIDKPILSICIPTHNGYPHITILIDELMRSSRMDFEVVVSDDCSTDETWSYCLSKSENDPRLKCFRNTNNLGMDGNFAKTVSLARGKYIWLCGQDDKIFQEGIDVVAEFLTEKPDLDFLYLNHVKVAEGDDTKAAPNALKPSYGDHHVCGHGLSEFLTHHAYELPTFLPKYILRKDLWDSVDVSRYSGTCYCQVGVFLEVSQNTNWCHLDGNYVVGLTPCNGWQVNPEQFTKISLGLYLMLYLASQKSSWLDEKILVGLVNKNYKRLILSCILIKSHGIKFNDSAIEEILNVIKCSPPLHFSIITILSMPRWFSLGILKLVNGRRKFRSTFLGVVPQGPKID